MQNAIQKIGRKFLVGLMILIFAFSGLMVTNQSVSASEEECFGVIGYGPYGFYADVMGSFEDAMAFQLKNEGGGWNIGVYDCGDVSTAIDIHLNNQ